MNKHILLVMKWLNNPESVTQEGLLASYESAVYSAAYTAVYWAVYWAAYDFADDATYWVNEYFKITSEDKQTYIDKLGE